MKFISSIALITITITITIVSCSRNNDGQNYTPTVDSSLNGTIYLQGSDSITAITIDPAGIKYKTQVYESFGSYYTYLDYDSGYLYKSTGAYNMVCYNATTGVWLWQYTFGPVYSGNSAVISQKMVFADTTLLFVQNYPFDGTYLYCLNKKTGRLIWKNKIFLGSGTLGPYKPVVEGDKVLVTGSNSSGIEVLLCFNRLTGQEIWEYPVTGSWTDLLEIYNGSLISWGNKITSVNIATGTLNWQVPRPATTPGLLFSGDYFPVGQRTLLVRNNNNNTNVYWINKTNGTVESSSTLPQNYSYCIYKDNKLVLNKGQDISDTMILTAYDATNFAALWTQKLPKYVPYNNLDFFPMIAVEDKIVVVQNYTVPPPVFGRARFFVIDYSTGTIQKEIALPIAASTKYFVIVKQNKVYNMHR